MLPPRRGLGLALALLIAGLLTQATGQQDDDPHDVQQTYFPTANGDGWDLSHVKHVKKPSKKAILKKKLSKAKIMAQKLWAAYTKKACSDGCRKIEAACQPPSGSNNGDVQRLLWEDMETCSRTWSRQHCPENVCCLNPNCKEPQGVEKMNLKHNSKFEAHCSSNPAHQKKDSLGTNCYCVCMPQNTVFSEHNIPAPPVCDIIGKRSDIFNQLHLLQAYASKQVRTTGWTQSNQNWKLRLPGKDDLPAEDFHNYFKPFEQHGLASFKTCPSYFAAFAGFARKLFVPNKALEARIAKKTQDMNLDYIRDNIGGKLIGVHFTTRDSYIAISFSEMSLLIKKHLKDHNAVGVYLLTDDKSLADELKKQWKDLAVVVFEYKATDSPLDLLAQTFILSRSVESLIGGCSSDQFRFMIEMGGQHFHDIHDQTSITEAQAYGKGAWFPTEYGSCMETSIQAGSHDACVTKVNCKKKFDGSGYDVKQYMGKCIPENEF